MCSVVISLQNECFIKEGDMNKLILLLLIVFLSGCSEEVKQEYYPNGKLKSEMRYKNGKLEGMTKGYYEMAS